MRGMDSPASGKGNNAPPRSLGERLGSVGGRVVGVGVAATSLMLIAAPAFAAVGDATARSSVTSSSVGAADPVVAGLGPAGLLWLVAGLLALAVGIMLARRPGRAVRDAAAPTSAPGDRNAVPSAAFTNSISHDEPNGARK